MIKAYPSRQVHYPIRYHEADAPTFVLSELPYVGKQKCVYLGGRQLLGKVDAAVDALHAYTVLLVLVNYAEDVEQLSLRNLRN
jgi:hypothetical protein